MTAIDMKTTFVSDSTQYNMKRGLNTLEKGGVYALQIVLVETQRAVETRQPDRLLNLVGHNAVAGKTAVNSTVCEIVKTLTDGSVTITERKGKRKVNFAKPEETAMNAEHEATVTQAVLDGRSLFGDAVLKALGLKASETKAVDYAAKLAKDVAELIKGGMDAKAIHKLVDDAISKQVASSAPAKPVMDGKPSRSADVQRLVNAA